MKERDKDRDRRDTGGRGEERPRVSGLAKVLLVLSIGLMLVGGGLWIYAAARPDPEPVARSGSDGPAGSAGFVGTSGDGDAADEDAPEEGGLETWSPTVFRFGSSFFIAFCVAYVVRAFVKIAVIVIGVLCLAIFGLQYAGVHLVDWHALGGHYDSVAAWLGAQTQSFTDFLTGSLPSAGAAGAGLVSGFRRRA